MKSLQQHVVRSLLTVLVLLAGNFSSKCQEDSCGLQFSLLTCTPGEELYSSFGHSAIRFINHQNGSDIVFNYGTFDFDDPDFYSKFIRGKLLYFVSMESFQDFMLEYQYFHRGVTEQVLNLSCAEKDQLLYALYDNAREENKYYKYDFNYDNCTTRLRDIVQQVCQDSFKTKNILPEKNISFRNLIHEYLDKGGQSWSKLGIDILLGAPLDKHVTNQEAMFLPDYLMKAFDSTNIGNKALVSKKQVLLPYTPSPTHTPLLSPGIIFGILFVLIAFLSSKGFKKYAGVLRVFDALFFFICGGIGLLLVFMWTDTDHAMCKNNMNLIWAIPSHSIMAFFVSGRRQWVRFYFRIIAIISLLLILSWFFLPQAINTALLPIAGIALIRSFLISKTKEK
ncbi:MAG: DUF4105 domain-containing protein [Terrimonas sp.]|nr:DUF4105 domain-containing protein [Terrimonas sp.]